MRSDVLVCEISGKRPGDKNARPTEKFFLEHDHVMITNNHDGYVTEWPVVEVPDDFREMYIENYKMSKSAWYAPMNRSYAIKYARGKGYKYCVQLDDNIRMLQLAYIVKGDVRGIYREYSSTNMMDDFIEMLACVLDNTNAAMAGMSLAGCAPPGYTFLREAYVYSFFALKLDICPDFFHGDFEDDIEYRIRCGKMGYPAISVCPMSYSKIGQRSSKDESGCRAAYTEVGVDRGKHMSMLNGDIYSHGLTNRPSGTRASIQKEVAFRHNLAPWKIGVLCSNRKAIDDKMGEILRKYATERPDRYIVRKKKKKGEAGGTGGVEEKNS